MSKTIGIAGTHGCGKTTFIHNVNKSLGYSYSSEHLSRQVQESRGWSNLNEIKHSFEVMQNFQNDILVSMVGRDKFAVHGHAAECLLDRTPFDLIAYSTLWYHHFQRPDDPWLKEYKAFCFEMINEYYGTIVLLNKLPSFTEEDHRASKDTQDECETLIKQFIHEYQDEYDDNTKFIEILSSDEQGRVKEFSNKLGKHHEISV